MDTTTAILIGPITFLVIMASAGIAYYMSRSKDRPQADQEIAAALRDIAEAIREHGRGRREG